MENVDKIISEFNNFNINITKEQAEKLNIYAEFLIDYNKKVNLTAITEFDEIVLKHFVDSAILLKYIDIGDGHIRLADVGAGAGFPSVVLKVLRGNINLCLIDTLRKRIDFLDELCKKLDLKNVETVHMRAEDISHNKGYREKFDIVTARAVTSLPILSELCIPLVKNDGIFIPLKGKSMEGEIINSKRAIDTLGGEILDKSMYSLENSHDRGVVIIRKYRQTPMKYPRKWVKISKSPI